MKIITKENTFSFLVIFFIIAPIAIIKLDAFPIRLWDESMFAVNAYEMLQRGEYIVPYYNGEMNLWNSKPPLLLWTQMLSIKAFGLNELAIRLPSAIAAITTVFLMFFFLKKHTNKILAWITTLVFITSYGFFTTHTGRTGDSDAILTLLLTSSNLLFIDSFLLNNISNKRIFLFFTLLSLAFLCKSFASLLFFPGYFIIILLKKDGIKTLLTKPAFWFGSLLFIGTSISFLLIRNSIQNGYIEFVFSTDIGRISKEVEAHKEPFLYYIESLSIYGFSFWFLLSLLGILLFFGKSLNIKTKELLKYTSTLALSFLLIISLSVSKLPWYTMPIYPFLSLFAAISIHHIINSTISNKKLFYPIICIIFIYPYYYIFGKSQSNPYSSYENINEASERYIFNEIKQNTYTDSSFILHSGTETALKFYEYKLRENGKTLFIAKNVNFKKNSTIIVSQPNLINELKKRYNYQLLDSSHYAIKVKIIDEINGR